MKSESRIAELKNVWRHWRRSVKSRLPWVRLSRFERLQQEFDLLNQQLVAGLPLAREARAVTIKAPGDIEGRELCLFVTHATATALKPHVKEHVQHFLDAGVAVALLINTDLDTAKLEIDPELLERLSACMVRENVGFDFAAWAHGWWLFRDCGTPQRLYFVNDSIVGPLSPMLFANMLHWIRQEEADVLGLTENISPRPHLQSFFLVFNRTVLASKAFRTLIDGIVSLPTKTLVICAYESWFTERLRQLGFRCHAMLKPLGLGPHDSNDLSIRWARLIRGGFPYVKTSVLLELRDDPDLAELVPARFRTLTPP